MSAEYITDKEEKKWRATKEFYNSNPRSAQIREMCIGILRNLDSLLYDSEVVESEERQSQIYAELEHKGGQLVGLGIEPKMHVGKPLEIFQSSPVITAEWVAGNLLVTSSRHVISGINAMPVIEEHSESIELGYRLKSPKDLPQEALEFLVMSSLVNGYHSLLDAEQERENPHDPNRRNS